MYYHVIENVQRNQVQGYRLVKTYKTFAGLDKYVRKNGGPVWVVTANTEYLPFSPREGKLGGFIASYWNTGGWGTSYLPVLPFFAK